MTPKPSLNTDSSNKWFEPNFLNSNKTVKITLVAVSAIALTVLTSVVLAYALNGNFHNLVNVKFGLMLNQTKSCWSWIQTTGFPSLVSAANHPMTLREAALYIGIPTILLSSMVGAGYLYSKI